MVSDSAGTRPVRFGILGCAEFARRRMAPAIRAHPGTELAAIASRDAARAAELAGRFDCCPITGYSALLDRDDIDAVYVPLPVALISDWTMRAIRAGKHVLAEKTVSVRRAEATELVAAAAERDLVVMPNFLFLHHAQQQLAEDVLARGELGEPRVVSASFGFPPRPQDDVRYRRDLGGGALLDAGVYPVRLVQRMLGDGLEPGHAVLRRSPGGCGPVDVSGAVQLHDTEGRAAQVSFGFDHDYRCRYEVWGSEASLIVERAFTAPPEWEPVVWRGRNGNWERLPAPADDQAHNLLGIFAGAVRGEQRPSVLRSGIVEHARLLEGILDVARIAD